MPSLPVSELSGHCLDAAVALAEGRPFSWHRERAWVTVWVAESDGPPSARRWQPSSRWQDGGPVIERHRIANDGDLAAAMRSFVRARLGDWVELPDTAAR